MLSTKNGKKYREKCCVNCDVYANWWRLNLNYVGGSGGVGKGGTLAWKWGGSRAPVPGE